MPDLNILNRLTAEYEAPFTGWDFSRLKGRMREDPSPWNYAEIAIRLFPDKEALLDMDTGGGEFLSSLGKLPPTAYATEGYEPNIPVAAERLKGKVAAVVPIKADGFLPFADNYFDIVLNRHGSFALPELTRILRPGGVFVTQQVGGLNAIDLNLSLGQPGIAITDWCLVSNLRAFRDAGFGIKESGEHIGKYRFFDIGAVVYYLKCVPWQLPGFTIDLYAERLEILDEIIQKNGYIDFLAHRFYWVASKPLAE